MTLIIKCEEKTEFEMIYHFIKEAFETATVSDGTEQDFVNMLRVSENYIPELALVATDNKQLIGHIMLTKFAFKGMLLLAPLTVKLDYRHQGVGTKLVQKAFELAKAIKEYPIDYIYSSDLGRAVQTAEIVGDQIGVKVNQTKSLREMGFGDWEGLLIDEIKKNHAKTYETWRNQPHLADIPNGETLHIIKDRVDAFIKELNEKYDNKHILLVSHSVTVRVMLLSFLNSGMENIYRIKQDNTALNIVECRNYGPVIIKMNDTSHIKNNEKLNNSALE